MFEDQKLLGFAIAVEKTIVNRTKQLTTYKSNKNNKQN